MRRLFSRLSQPDIVLAELGAVDKDAHGCPACPHPASFLESMGDDDSSTLLPRSGLALDGEPAQLDFAAVGFEGALKHDIDFDDVDLDASDFAGD